MSGRALRVVREQGGVVLFAVADQGAVASSRCVQLHASPGTPEGPVRAVRLPEQVFAELLRSAIAESFDPTVYGSKHAWRLATRHAQVLARWEPDLVFTLRSAAVGRFGSAWVEVPVPRAPLRVAYALPAPLPALGLGG